ncbi:MAG: DUF1328 domain-containing protein, partial [Deltaproteobacteria bacterium]|nr:DUF1328 domain-containing protein [Deltaproteobacteria bacterium]
SFAFLVIALIAALLGFTDIAAGAADIARVLFGIFITICLALFISGIFIVKRK